MSDESMLLMGVTAVAIAGRALILEGPPGVGKSGLALALIDRGAQLIGDDGVRTKRSTDRLLVNPPPNIAGLIEIRNVGIVEMPVAEQVPLALILMLSDNAERLPERAGSRNFLGCTIPELPFTPGAIAPAVRAEWALHQHGLSLD